jgi:hypothetical protein
LKLNFYLFDFILSAVSEKSIPVLQRSKSAAKMISELEKQNKMFSLKCAMSNAHLPPISSNKEYANKSPLIANDNNLLFKFQATTSKCRKAIESNPIRNISDSMLPIAQNLNMDLLSLSLKVGKEAGSPAEKQQQQLQLQPRQQPVMHQTKQVSHNMKQAITSIGIQTERNECKNCDERERVRRESKGAAVQTSNTLTTCDAGVQCVEDGDSFSFTIDSVTLQNRTFEQHHALDVFVKAFKIPSCKFLNLTNNFDGRERPYRHPKDKELIEKMISDDSRMNFANPENPNPENHTFISLSPLREVRRSVSPKRVPIFNRIGEKIRNNDRYNPSPPGIHRGGNSNHYRVPSLPDHSPHGSDRVSPDTSVHFRNRSRSRERCVSPPRQRRRFDLNDRRGRY